MNPIRIFPIVGILALTSFQGVEAAGRPNLLFIMTDQQFAEAMSCRMGDRWVRTPAMDGLAARGMLFSRAYSANPLCMPSRNSIFTGRYPHQTGVTRNDPPSGGRSPADFKQLGAYFHDAGYAAGYSGKWHLTVSAKNTAAHGFEMLKGLGDNTDAQVTDGALRFLARNKEKPFLLVASYLNPHNICEWARRLSGRKQALSCGEIGEPPAADLLPPPPANLELPAGEPDGMTLIRRAYQVPNGPFPVSEYTSDDWRRHRWGYYRMIEKVDGEIGRLLAAVRAAGLESNTVVVFTSDHGECAGAHRFNQKTVLYEESARVPLIVSWPGHTPAGTCDRLINTGVDILPTLLQAAGLPVPAELPGLSLWPLALGGSASAWRDHVVVENDMCQTGQVDGFKPEMQGRMVRTDRFKYCLYSHGERRESLVDLQADPQEMKNLAADPAHRDELLRHRQLLAEFARSQQDAQAESMLAGGVPSRPFRAAAAQP